MSRIEVESKSLSPSAISEKMQRRIAELRLKREELVERFGDFYHKQEQRYQPICLKDFYLFDLDHRSKQYLKDFDVAFAAMLSIAEQRCDDPEILKHFVDLKARCSVALSNMEFLLRPSQNDMPRQHLFFLKELLSFEGYAKEKIQHPQKFDYAMRLFREKSDVYAKFFNHHVCLPEVRSIRSYVKQSRYPGLSVFDPGHIDFLIFCMSIEVKKLEEAMHAAHVECSKAHQEVLRIKNLEPDAKDSDDDYVDCAL